MDPRLSLIFARRSIRNYGPSPVSEADTRSLLEAAMAAPSANNRKPWSFVVVREQATLRRLADAHPHGKMLAGAPLAIAVCADPSASGSWVVDCAAATENLLLAAAGLGLGGVWLGVNGSEDRETAIRPILGIPQAQRILSLVSIGHPAETKEPRTQYEESRVHRERW